MILFLLACREPIAVVVNDTPESVDAVAWDIGGDVELFVPSGDRAMILIPDGAGVLVLASESWTWDLLVDSGPGDVIEYYLHEPSGATP